MQPLSLRAGLERLTILVPTYERPARLRRSIAWWGGLGQHAIIMDGSASPLPEDLLRKLPECIDYRHRPIPIAARLEEAITAASTPYVALCGDDEFHLPSGLAASVKALDEDMGLVAAMGQCVGFSVNKRGQVRFFKRYPDLQKFEISQQAPQERVFAQMRHYAPRSIYAVVRREVWHAAMHPIMRREFPVYASGELQFELLVALSGRTKILPVVHWLRSHEVVANGHSGSDTSLSRKVTIADRWGDASFREEFCCETAQAYCAVTGGDTAEVAAGVCAGLDAYVQHFVPASRRRGLMGKLRHHLSRLRRPMAVMCRQLEREAVCVNRDEISRAMCLVAEQHPR
jgi:glycosyltransferase domain-containing protein